MTDSADIMKADKKDLLRQIQYQTGRQGFKPVMNKVRKILFYSGMINRHIGLMDIVMIPRIERKIIDTGFFWRHCEE